MEKRRWAFGFTAVFALWRSRQRRERLGYIDANVNVKPLLSITLPMP